MACFESRSYLIKGFCAWFCVMLCQRMFLYSQSLVNQGSKGMSLPLCLAFVQTW